MTSKNEALILEQLAEINRKLGALTVQPSSNNTISPSLCTSDQAVGTGQHGGTGGEKGGEEMTSVKELLLKEMSEIKEQLSAINLKLETLLVPVY